MRLGKRVDFGPSDLGLRFERGDALGALALGADDLEIRSPQIEFMAVALAPLDVRGPGADDCAEQSGRAAGQNREKCLKHG